MPKETPSFHFDTDFQDLILACMIKHPERFAAVGDVVRPEYFYGVQSMRVCKAIQTYNDKHNFFPAFEALGNYVFDLETKDDQEKARLAKAYVVKLSKMDLRDIDYVVESTVKFARERAIINAIRDSAARIQEGKWPEEGFAPMFDRALRVGENIEDIGYDLKEDVDKIIDKVTAESYGVRTKYAPLDAIWFNGWGPGWLVVPLAPPKSYKSAICTNLALNMVNSRGSEEGVTVFYYACELSAELTAMRAYARLAGVKLEDFYKGKKAMSKVAAKAALEKSVHKKLIVKYFPAKTATIKMIRTHVKMAVDRFGVKPKAIFIDHAETIRPSQASKGISDWRQQADIYTEARALGDEFKCVVVMPDRCNREACESATPSMTGFQGALEKAGIVDVGIGICQSPDERKPDPMDEQGRQSVRYFVFLNRHGRQYVHLAGHVNPETMEMTIEKEIPWSEADSKKNGHGSTAAVPGPKTLLMDEDASARPESVTVKNNGGDNKASVARSAVRRLDKPA